LYLPVRTVKETLLKLTNAKAGKGKLVKILQAQHLNPKIASKSNDAFVLTTICFATTVAATSLLNVPRNLQMQ